MNVESTEFVILDSAGNACHSSASPSLCSPLPLTHTRCVVAVVVVGLGAGSYSPVRVTDELSVAQKEATELFLLELIFDMSDYFLFVVNDYTSLDQR